MPIYEFVCQDCSHQFETLVGSSGGAECPACRSEKLEKQLSVFGVGSADNRGSGPAPAGCGRCGDPRGPGSCAM